MYLVHIYLCINWCVYVQWYVQLCYDCNYCCWFWGEWRYWCDNCYQRCSMDKWPIYCVCCCSYYWTEIDALMLLCVQCCYCIVYCCCSCFRTLGCTLKSLAQTWCTNFDLIYFIFSKNCFCKRSKATKNTVCRKFLSYRAKSSNLSAVRFGQFYDVASQN